MEIPHFLDKFVEMEVSLFLAKFLGLYFVVMSLFLLLRKNLFQECVDNLFKNSCLILFSGSFLVIMGLLIILSHPVWEMNWRVIITILGYLILLKGLVRVYFPSWGRDLVIKFAHGNACNYTGWLILLLGIFLAAKGFGM